MPKASLPVQVQRCAKCGFTYWAPMKQTVWCPNRHTSKGRNLPPVQLEVIWDRSMNSDPPAATVNRPQRKLVDVQGQ